MTDEDGVWERYKKAILSELTFENVYGQIKNQTNGNGAWLSGLCPFHEDRHNSFSFNRKTLHWVCFAGCGKGDVFDFLMRSSGRSFKETLIELGERLKIPAPVPGQPKKPPIKEEAVRKFSESLSDEMRRYLREERGLSDVTTRKYQIGWDAQRQRITIPIRDERGNLVNVRLYSPGKEPKIVNYTQGVWKYGSPARLYGIDELVNCADRQVIICEGEWDRILLRQEGFMAVTGTHGCSVFRPEWIPYFKGKDAVIIYDCDEKGRAASDNIVLKAFRSSEVSSIKNVVLPLRGEKDDKDVTDYLHKRGSTGADLQQIIDEVPAYEYREEKEEEEVIRLDSFTDIEKKEYIDKKVECEIAVCGETSEAFHAVQEFRVNFCPRLRKGECFDCAEPIEIPPSCQEYIGSCMSTNVQLTAMLRWFCCGYGQKPAIEILKRTTIKEFFCHQRVNRVTQTRDEDGNLAQFIDGRKQELMEKRVYYLSSEGVRPGDYLATGYVKTHPKTQQVTFLIESLLPQEDDYQKFDLEQNLDHLRAFKGLSWSDILKDLTENVTRVFERDEILAAILLTYCSPLWIRFNGETVRGWLLSAITGDSGSGKTQSYSRFAEFVNIGDCFSGLTGTRTGLAYALVEHKQKGWQVKIGRYPANSGKILIVDETQHLPDWDLRAISKAMEEGFIQIDRVKSRGYESMTRLIMICNPRGDQVMDSYSFGCETLKGLFSPTIIRRIDLAVFANSGDLQDLSFINRKRPEHTGGKITPDMLRAVIYWTWNLKPENVVFTPEAEEVCLSQADRMSDVFGYAVDIPLVPPSDFRNTLARISAAFAAVLLSTDESFSSLIVETEHVNMAVEFLCGIYSHDNCGLDTYSDIQRIGSQLTDYEDIEEAFLRRKENEKHDYQNEAIFTRAIYIFRISEIVRREDLAEQVGCSVEPIKKVVKLLKRFNLIESGRDGYVKKPKFNKFLRRFLRKHPDFFGDEASGFS